MTETFVLTYDHEQVLAENAALQAEIERLREENFALRQLAKPETRRIEAEQLQKLGARLAELLDEDKWAECEALLLAAGVTPNAELRGASRLHGEASLSNDVLGAERPGKD